MTTNFNQDGR